jgi:uncharacterized membrane protein YkvA (DUF1232 family)
MLALWLRAKMFWAMRRNATRVARLFLDQRVHLALKASTALAALLIISPLDIFGDVPGLGLVDDTALLMMLAWVFVRLCPAHVVAEHFGPPAGRRLKNVTPS